MFWREKKLSRRKEEEEEEEGQAKIDTTLCFPPWLQEGKEEGSDGSAQPSGEVFCKGGSFFDTSKGQSKTLLDNTKGIFDTIFHH